MTTTAHCVALLALLAGSLAAAPIKVLKLSVTNPTADGRLAERIILRVADLQRIAPDFDPANAIVTVSDAATRAGCRHAANR